MKTTFLDFETAISELEERSTSCASSRTIRRSFGISDEINGTRGQSQSLTRTSTPSSSPLADRPGRAPPQRPLHAGLRQP